VEKSAQEPLRNHGVALKTMQINDNPECESRITPEVQPDQNTAVTLN
jgi:hypothetical protein